MEYAIRSYLRRSVEHYEDSNGIDSIHMDQAIDCFESACGDSYVLDLSRKEFEEMLLAILNKSDLFKHVPEEDRIETFVDGLYNT